MKDIEKALLTQTDQLKKSAKTLSDLQTVATDVEGKTTEHQVRLEELDEQMGDLFSMLGLERETEEIQNAPVSKRILLSDTELQDIQYKLPKFNRIPTLEVRDWESYSRDVNKYIQTYELDLSVDPIKQMLTSQQIKEIEAKYYREFGDLRWNKWDYTVVGLAALVGFLVDLLLVKLPAGGASKYVSASQQSPVGKWINKMTDSYLNPDNNAMIKRLEIWAKTPYDAVRINDFQRIIPESDKIKINANLHRLKTPGHDPILQLVFGVLDCFNGTMTVFDQKGNLAVLDNPNFQGMNLFMSIVKTLSHFITDIGTKKGVAPPFFSLTQAITLDTPFEINDKGTIRKMRLNELGERMFTHGGYNFNHFLTMSLTPLSVELIVRAYHWLSKPDSIVEYKRDYKLSSMLTLAHSLTMSGNVIKMWMNGWNPLAFNYSEMLMLVKSFYSLYQAGAEREKVIDETLMDNWKQIYQTI
ncbi:hypothetical protein EJF36_18890 [Bacillus sp. HMF5848]|uniref:hypothetical protein n=1 Tax=Bacillus sp. HMF5848 TaxID=2495421 RepID=UPI000F7B5D4D|nr:hypothetical protein [Bacillus sp. HMF5848]RSK28774.1 hypothetical protein EJF36_18890 [Bacillus sp. HMF5848]